MKWRVVITDSESPHGVATWCGKPDAHAQFTDHGSPDDFYVYEDCCGADVVIECFGYEKAKRLAKLLTDTDAEYFS